MILTNILLSILILVSICLCYQQQILKLDCKTKIIDNFDPNNDMYNDESMNVFKKVRFSLDCCPSTYSNDKGCACIDDKDDKKKRFKCKKK